MCSQHGYTASDAAKFVVVEEPAPPVQEEPVEPQPVVPVDAAIVAEGGRPPVEDPLVADSLSDVPQGVVATEDSLLATEALAGDEGSLVADAAAAEPLNEEEPSPDVTVQDASLLSTLVPDLNEVKASSEAPTARITASPATAGSKMLISKGKRLGDQSYFTVSVSQLPSGDVRFNSVSVRDAGLVFKRNVSLSELATLSDKHCDSVAEVHAAVAVLFDRLVVLDNRLEFPGTSHRLRVVV